MAEPIRVLIVDDHAIVREGLKAILDSEPGMTVAGQAADGKEALDRFEELRPEVTLLDVHLPGESGLDTLETIRRRHPAARVLVISTYDHDEDIFRALRLGAKGYILKDVESRDLVAAIRAVHEGRKFIPSWVGERLAGHTEGADLSDREREVLQLLAEGKSNKEIGTALGISEGTIKAHLSHVFEKLGAADRTQALLVALRRGIIHLD